MNPKGCNFLSISWDITAAVVWLQASTLIISLLVGSQYPNNGALSNFFLSSSNVCWCLSSHFHFDLFLSTSLVEGPFPLLLK